MRKTLLTFISAVTVILMSGCQDEYLERIEDLNARVDSLSAICVRLNANLSSAESVITALQSNYMIGPLTQTDEGYTITFIKNDGKTTFSRTIYNGKDGGNPIVDIQYDNGVPYWAVKYGDSKSWSWIYDGNYNRIPVMGNIPYIRINDKTGMWEVSFNKKDWTEIGKANGDQGDSIFKDVNITADYVIFTLSDGTSIKLPTYSAYQDVMNDISRVAENSNAMKLLISSMDSTFVYVTEASSILNEGDTIGMYVRLSTGKDFKIYNYTGTNIPSIFSRLDTLEGRRYWVIQYDDEPEEWICDENGDRILYKDIDVIEPVIDVQQGEDGQFYWTVNYSDTTVWLGINEKVHALDSVRNSIFSKVEDTEDFLRITLKDSTVFELPKIFSLNLSACDSIHLFANDSLTMYSFGEARDTLLRDTAYVKYTAYGTDRTDVTLIAQGGFTAKSVTDSTIMIIAPVYFEEPQGKIVAVFSLDGNGSTKTVCKTIQIKRELRKEEE